MKKIGSELLVCLELPVYKQASHQIELWETNLGTELVIWRYGQRLFSVLLDEHIHYNSSFHSVVPCMSHTDIRDIFLLILAEAKKVWGK